MAKAQNGSNGNKGGGAGLKAAAGIGLAALAAAAAGAYYFYGKDGAKNRKQLKGWMVTAKGEVMDKMEQLQDISEGKYGEVVAQVMKKYKSLKQVNPAEWVALNRELLGHWKAIRSEIDQASSKVKQAKSKIKPTQSKSKSKSR